MDNKVLGLIVGGIVAAVLTILGVVYMVTSGEDAPAPAPVTSSAPAPTPEPSATPTSGGDEFILEILEQTWNEQSYKDQQSLCWLFDYSPEEAWNAFDDGSEHLVPKDVFIEFFSGKCATIT